MSIIKACFLTIFRHKFCVHSLNFLIHSFMIGLKFKKIWIPMSVALLYKVSLFVWRGVPMPSRRIQIWCRSFECVNKTLTNSRLSERIKGPARKQQFFPIEILRSINGDGWAINAQSRMHFVLLTNARAIKPKLKKKLPPNMSNLVKHNPDNIGHLLVP